MKKVLFSIIAMFAFQIVSAQDTVNVSTDILYDTVAIEVKPEFPGGIGEFYKYFAKNYRTPNVKKLNGKVYVSFIIEKDGSINEIKVLRDIGYGTGEEAIRVLKLSPNWKPGEQNGRKVRCSYNLPIAIDTR